jgi:group I intron endonuclease
MRGKVDYSKGLIYAIYCSLNEDFYIGSTTNLNNRWYEHKKSIHKNKLTKLYQSMKEYGVDNFKIELIEYYPCNSKKELERREGEIQRERKPNLNMNIACRTIKEWREDNIDKIQSKQKQYYKDNIETIKIMKQKYQKENEQYIKQKKKEYYQENKDKKIQKAKTYYLENVEKVKEYSRLQSKIYYQNNKEKIKEKYKDVVYCECGGHYTKNHQKRHLNSKLHLSLLMKNEKVIL